MAAHEIPFGKHKETGRYYDAGEVSSGLKCNCICKECGTELEAVKRRIPRTKNYFRHANKLNCKGGLESLFHQVAKQILKESNELHISHRELFSYSQCDIEIPKYEKQPDAYISNESTSLIVEIFFWHRIDRKTLRTYLDNNERVLEIDISSERKEIFDYEYVKELILSKATRKLYTKANHDKINSGDNIPWWAWLLFITGVGIIIWFIRKQKNSRRKRRKW